MEDDPALWRLLVTIRVVSGSDDVWVQLWASHPSSKPGISIFYRVVASGFGCITDLTFNRSLNLTLIIVLTVTCINRKSPTDYTNDLLLPFLHSSYGILINLFRWIVIRYLFKNFQLLFNSWWFDECNLISSQSLRKENVMISSK